MVSISGHSVFAFDRGYSVWFLPTETAKGEFYDLAGPKSDSRLPIARHYQRPDVAGCGLLIEVLCELNGLKFTPKHRNCVADAVEQLRLSPHEL